MTNNINIFINNKYVDFSALLNTIHITISRVERRLTIILIDPEAIVKIPDVKNNSIIKVVIEQNGQQYIFDSFSIGSISISGMPHKLTINAFVEAERINKSIPIYKNMRFKDAVAELFPNKKLIADGDILNAINKDSCLLEAQQLKKQQFFDVLLVVFFTLQQLAKLKFVITHDSLIVDNHQSVANINFNYCYGYQFNMIKSDTFDGVVVNQFNPKTAEIEKKIIGNATKIINDPQPDAISAVKKYQDNLIVKPKFNISLPFSPQFYVGNQIKLQNLPFDLMEKQEIWKIISVEHEIKPKQHISKIQLA